MGEMYPEMKPVGKAAFAGLYLDLQEKAARAEITTKSLDLRGLFGAIGTISRGLAPYSAVRMGIVNKCFDIFEKEIVEDVARTRIPEEWKPEDLF